MRFRVLPISREFILSDSPVDGVSGGIIHQWSVAMMEGAAAKLLVEENIPQVPLISIVMINYNGKRYLTRSVPSVLSMRYPNFEFILVDNGSTDGSQEYASGLRSVRLIHNPRVGEKNSGCNLGVEHARGEYLLLLDNDIIITEESLLDNIIEDYTREENTGSMTLSYHHEGEQSCIGYGAFYGWNFKRQNKRLMVKDFQKLHGQAIGYPQGIGIFIRKALWDELEGYDSVCSFGGDDKDIGLRLWQMGYTNRLYARSVQVHLGMPERTDTTKYCRKFKELVFSDLYTIAKGFTRVNAIRLLAGYSVYTLLKSIKQSIQRKDIRPFTGYCFGCYKFIKSIPVIIEKRKAIQGKRIVKADICLKLPVPRVRSERLRVPLFSTDKTWEENTACRQPAPPATSP